MYLFLLSLTLFILLDQTETGELCSECLTSVSLASNVSLRLLPTPAVGEDTR